MARLMTIVVLMVFGTALSIAAEQPQKSSAEGKMTAEQPRKSGAEGRKAPALEVRDWEAMDTNQDNSISPQEMQKYFADRAKTKKAS